MSNKYHFEILHPCPCFLCFETVVKVNMSNILYKSCTLFQYAKRAKYFLEISMFTFTLKKNPILYLSWARIIFQYQKYPGDKIVLVKIQYFSWPFYSGFDYFDLCSTPSQSSLKKFRTVSFKTNSFKFLSVFCNTSIEFRGISQLSWIQELSICSF